MEAAGSLSDPKGLWPRPTLHSAPLYRTVSTGSYWRALRRGIYGECSTGPLRPQLQSSSARKAAIAVSLSVQRRALCCPGSSRPVAAQHDSVPGRPAELRKRSPVQSPRAVRLGRKNPVLVPPLRNLLGDSPSRLALTLRRFPNHRQNNRKENGCNSKVASLHQWSRVRSVTQQRPDYVVGLEQSLVHSSSVVAYT
jgi:hypothetical protein